MLFAAFRYGLAAVACSVPVVATVVGILVLGESIALPTAAGFLLFFAGCVLPKRRAIGTLVRNLCR